MTALPPPPAHTSVHRVKQVLSGDTVVVLDGDREKTVALAHISAPRMGSHKKGTADEPMAFEARDTLRRVLVGKEVAIRTEYMAGEREFVACYARSPKSQAWVNVVLLILQRGQCKLRDKANPSDHPDSAYDFQLFNEAQKRAQLQEVGLWGDQRSAIDVANSLDDPAAFVRRHQKRKLTGIVEHVRDGASLRIRFLLDDKHQFTWVNVSGVMCPRIGGPNERPEPFAEQARDWTESRLLQRDVQCTIEDVVPGNNTSNSILATIEHAQVGNLAVQLVRSGLAKVDDWTVQYVTSGPAQLRSAERQARERRLGVWHDASPSRAATTASGASSRSRTGKLIKVVSPDILIVKEENGTEHKFFLASVRAPRRSGADSELEAGYWEVAREHVRSRFIGKTVTFVVEYNKPAQGEYEAREYASIADASTGADIATDLLNAGLAFLQRPPRRTDDAQPQRASHFDALVDAEAQAMSARRGIHSGKPAPAPPRYNDVSETPAKARQFLPFLHPGTARRVQATVEHVVNGSRLRVVIPRQSAKLSVVLAGVRVPRQGEPYADDALAKTTELCYQRDIELEVDAVDRTGGFIATVYIGGRKNLGAALCEAGLAYVHGHSAEKTRATHELQLAERKAKEARLGVWADYDSDAEKQAADEDEDEAEEVAAHLAATSFKSGSPAPAAGPAAPKLASVIISEYVSATHVFVQPAGADAVAKLEKMMRAFATHPHGSQPQLTSCKVNDVVAAKFTADDCWYRARVKRVQGKQVQVQYIDYGNSETLPLARVRALPAQFSLSSLPAQAAEFRLAYIRAPHPITNPDYAEAALDRLRDLTTAKKLIGSIERAGWIVLYDPTTLHAAQKQLDFAQSINAVLVRDGCALPISMPKRGGSPWGGKPSATAAAAVPTAPPEPAGPAPPTTEHVRVLEDARDDARSAHLGIWEYGDVDEDAF